MKNYTTVQLFRCLVLGIIASINCGSLFAQGDDFRRSQKIVSSNRHSDNQFGSTVAMSSDGNYAMVGEPNAITNELDQDSIYAAGAIYIYERNANGSWDEVQKLVAPVRATGDQFGTAICISGDYALVSAPQEDENAAETGTLTEAGAVYVIKRNGSGVWSVVQKLVPNDRVAYEYFGQSVSIDGTQAIIGSPYNSTDASNLNNVTSAGAAYLFNLNGNVWSQTQKIVAPTRNSGDLFGYSVSVSSAFAAIGCPSQDTDASNLNPLTDAGATYVYEFYSNIFNFFQKLTPTDRVSGDNYGLSVSMEGSRIAVGSPRNSFDANGLNGMNYSGSIYAYRLLVSPSLAFYFDGKMTSTDRSVDTYVGYNIKLSGDYIISSSLSTTDENAANPISGAGAAYIFKRTATWDQWQKKCAPIREQDDQYSSVGTRCGVALSYNPTTAEMIALIGAPYEDDDLQETNHIDYAGSAYFYGKCTNTATQVTLTACNNIYWLGNYYDASGTYQDTIPNAIGCDSIITLQLTINFLDTTLSYTNGNLIANQSNANYQWFNCQTNQPIAGATSQSFTPSVNGFYFVVITSNGGCSDTSECVLLNDVGLNEGSISTITLAPNPASESFTVTSSELIEELVISDVSGKIIQTVTPTVSANQLEVNVSAIPRGIYFIRVSGNNGAGKVQKIILR